MAPRTRDFETTKVGRANVGAAARKKETEKTRRIILMMRARKRILFVSCLKKKLKKTKNFKKKHKKMMVLLCKNRRRKRRERFSWRRIRSHGTSTFLDEREKERALGGTSGCDDKVRFCFWPRAEENYF